MFKKMQVRLLSFLLTIVMVLGMMPVSALAAKTRNGETENVYVSVSYDGQFIEDQNGDPIAYVAVPIETLAAIDLDTYGLSDFYYDGDGDGNYDVTALHLYIYTHEELFGLDWSDVRVSGGSGSIFFEKGLFGFEDCNLNYYLNGAYPELYPGWGATADNLSLKAGDFYDIAAYTSWNFYGDPAAGFHYFADSDGAITHEYTVEASEEANIKLVRTGGGFGNELSLVDVGSYDVYYGTALGNAEGSVTTDDSGEATLSALDEGTWYLWCDGGYGEYYPDEIVSAPAYATLTVKASTPTEREPQDVSAVLNATMAQLADTVDEPAFGTNAGEWTVLSLARGGYYELDDEYFVDYYDRIVEYVNEQAAEVDMNGALHKSKCTDNSRLILALSSIGKDATSVGDWNLITPYNDFNWIKKQGTNSIIFALLALDSNDYQTIEDSTIRQQCVEYLLEKQLEGGGWSLSGTSFSADITAMALQALYPYSDEDGVTEAADQAFARLSKEQLTTGGFLYGTGETSESAAQVIVACTTWGINPDTDSRFVKDGNSVVDNLLTYYLEDEAMFAHQGTTSNGMATDQACYALVAYDRLLKGKTALYDYSDVEFETDGSGNSGDASGDGEMKVSLSVPKELSATKKNFSAVININKWDNLAGYKLIDFIMTVPDGVTVEEVTAGDALNGGEVQYNQEADTNKLRVVYFDVDENNDITMSAESFPAKLFTVKFAIDDISETEKLELAITGMSVKKSSDSSDASAMVVVDSENASGSILVTDEEIVLHALGLYTGDGVDLIPSDKKAVAIALDGIHEDASVVYKDETHTIKFLYNVEISDRTDMPSYVALVDKAISMKELADLDHYKITEETQDTIMFGDSNGDGVVNAQDALAAVDAWLRKGDALTDDQILALNVNGDSRLNTFDALGIVEAVVNGTDFAVVEKAAKLGVEDED